MQIASRIEHLATHGKELVVVDTGRSGVSDSRCIPGVLIPRGMTDSSTWQTSTSPVLGAQQSCGRGRKGMPVTLTGLGAKALNGRRGCITGPQHANGRFPVCLDPDPEPDPDPTLSDAAAPTAHGGASKRKPKTISVKAENLAAVPSIVFLDGDLCAGNHTLHKSK